MYTAGFGRVADHASLEVEVFFRCGISPLPTHYLQLSHLQLYKRKLRIFFEIKGKEMKTYRPESSLKRFNFCLLFMKANHIIMLVRIIVLIYEKIFRSKTPDISGLCCLDA